MKPAISVACLLIVALFALVSGCNPQSVPPTDSPVAGTATLEPQDLPTDVLSDEPPQLSPTAPAPTETPAPEPTSTPAPLPEGVSPGGGVFFVDSGQRLGEMRSWNVAIGDLDGDGDLDAFVANDLRSQIWLNNGQGSFSPGEVRSKTVSDLELGDLDRDGDLDAFAVDMNHSAVIWLNDGSAGFSTGQRFPSDVTGSGVALGDVDADGDLDAHIARNGFNLLWLNDGSGEFVDSGQRLGRDHPVNDMSCDSILGDLDGDGDLDVFEITYGGLHRVWLNDGAGFFTDSGQDIDVGSGNSHGAALGDLDQDGDLDAFITITDPLAFQVWFNDGVGGFTDSGQSLPSSNAQMVALGDLDGDGDLDAFMTNTGLSGAGSGNTVWLNDGNGNFFDSGLRLGSAYSLGLALEDLDGDGDLDAFVANSYFSSSSSDYSNRIWLNTTP
ncbi:MAG TPA: hypothetical protein G4O08_08345 [Anaerolineae bacterium]|nr:hypothetical protein [Anaerolineae bacterium]